MCHAAWMCLLVSVECGYNLGYFPPAGGVHACTFASWSISANEFKSSRPDEESNPDQDGVDIAWLDRRLNAIVHWRLWARVTSSNISD